MLMQIILTKGDFSFKKQAKIYITTSAAQNSMNIEFRVLRGIHYFPWNMQYLYI